MAFVKQRAGLEATKPQVLEDDRDELVSATKDLDAPKDKFEPLVQWVTQLCDEWRTDRQTNYENDWDQYERLFRGIYSPEEQQRKSERSRIVTPALSEAVENCVSELEEAVFGRGDFFEMKAEASDPEEFKNITDHNKTNLREDLARSDFVFNNGQALLSGAIYGDMIGEIVMKTETIRDVVPQFDEEGQIIGAEAVEYKQELACLRAIPVRNFLIDPNARTSDEGLGCAIEEYVGLHEIKTGQNEGSYRDDVEVGESSGDIELGKDPVSSKTEYTRGKAHVYRYYGLVPRNLLDVPDKDSDDKIESAIAVAKEKGSSPDMPQAPTKVEADLSDMVEAIVIIANKHQCLKAESSPYLMKDRPIVFANWDTVPGRLRGRGVCEKGATPQKLLDAEMRSRMDALAFAGAPMMGLDASKLPRGFTLKVYPGRSILTNGDPSTILKPITFGTVDQNTWQQADALDKMVQRATGGLDGVRMAEAGAGGQARSGAVSMSMSGIVKRHKRTLMNFTDRFFVPALRKIMWRNMQFNPKRYVPFNFTFNASNVMGIMQREYESQHLAQLLNTMEPQSREYKMILMGMVDNSGLAKRQEIVAMLKKSIDADIATQEQQTQAAAQASQDPMQQQLQQVVMALEIAEKQGKVRELNARAGLQEQKAATEVHEPELRAAALATKGIYDTPDAQMAGEFDRRMQIADKMLQAEDIASNERITTMQTQSKGRSDEVNAKTKLAAEIVKARSQMEAKRTEAKGKVRTEVVKAHGAATTARIGAAATPQPVV